MRLDVVIPTYNRREMLRRTLESLLAAPVPSGLDVGVTVVDNNSRDQTRQLVESLMERFNGRLSYVFEARQGRSHALNAGIASTDGDMIGTIDDDEEIDRNWYIRAYSAFNENDIDFIGGPAIPRYGTDLPAWIPMDYKAVIGWVDGGSSVVPYDENYPGILMGGNAVLTRTTLEKVGPYSTALGRTDKHLLSCEDEDMYRRLLAVNARGLYLPDLIIYHNVLPERLTKRYFRQWCFWRSVSAGIIDRQHRLSLPYLGGVPRYLYGEAARGLLGLAKGLFYKGDPAQTFSAELSIYNLAGFFYGKHFYKSS